MNELAGSASSSTIGTMRRMRRVFLLATQKLEAAAR